MAIEYVSERKTYVDRETGEYATFKPDTSKPKNQDILDESDPRIQRLWDFIVAGHWLPFPVKEHVCRELVFDYEGKKSIRELLHHD